jgi:hypothetical protein
MRKELQKKKKKQIQIQRAGAGVIPTVQGS